MPFNIVIDFDYWYKLKALNSPISIAWQLIKDGGWVVFVFLFLYMIWVIWHNWRGAIAKRDWTYSILSIEIPKNNEQSPKAVEYIFSQLAAVYSKGNFVDRHWKVKAQESFSFEIVSDGGYLRFYVWTNSNFRDLVEAAIYAQYPDAIISEVEDYTKDFIEQRFPNEKYEMYGTEMKLANKNAYPIRTYPMFEHALSQELKDPMASMLEILTRVKPGEKIWIQLVLAPIDSGWTSEGKSIIKKITGQGGGGDKGLLDKISDIPLRLITLIDEAIFPENAGSSSSDSDDFSLQKLTPGEVDALKAIENKISKIGFKTNFRIVYLAPKELFDKKRVISGFLGSLQQFSILGLNSFKTSGKHTTSVDYFFVKSRVAALQNRILSKYIGRSGEGSKIILNIEELATIYHFPVMTVKVPMLSKIESKRSEAPVGLPAFVPESAEEISSEEGDIEKKDEFISLLEEMSARNIESSGADIGVPEDLVKKENVEAERVEITKDKDTAPKISNESNGVPSNLPIAG